MIGLVTKQPEQLMDIQELAAWGEFLGGVSGVVGSIAVVATLVYLAVQTKLNTEAVKANREALKAQIYQSRTDSRRRNLEWTIDSQAANSMPAMNELIATGKLDSLDDADRLRLRQFMELALISMDNHVYQHQHDVLDDDYYNTYTVRNIRQLAPVWRALGLDPYDWRRAFGDEVKRIAPL